MLMLIDRGVKGDVFRLSTQWYDMRCEVRMQWGGGVGFDGKGFIENGLKK